MSDLLNTVENDATRQLAIVTGASRGIGRAIAERLAMLGYDLLLLGRDAAALDSTRAECSSAGVTCEVFAGDVTDDQYLDEALAKALSMNEAVDVLVNNAGTALGQSVHEADLPAWRSVMRVNFDAVLALSAKVLPGMVSRGQGTVVHISSISGRNSPAGSGIYSASKHALNGLAGSMFEDVRDHGIKVSTIMPGFVQTDLTENLPIDAQNMIRPSDVADSVAYVLSCSAFCCPVEIVLRPQTSL